MTEPLDPAPARPLAPIFLAPTAVDGWRWLKTGFQLFWLKPWALSSIAILLIMTPMLLGLIPVVGGALALIAVPGLTAGAMYAVFSVSQGVHPLPHSIFAPFFWGPSQQNLPRLRAALLLGVLYALALSLSYYLLRSLAGDSWQVLKQIAALSQNQTTLDSAEIERLAQSAPQLAGVVLAMAPIFALLFLLFTRANMLSFCFAINPGKALFFALHSIWRSLAALLVFGLLCFGASALVANLMLLHPFAYALGLITASSIFICSLWAMFGSSFPPPTAKQPAP